MYHPHRFTRHDLTLFFLIVAAIIVFIAAAVGAHENTVSFHNSNIIYDIEIQGDYVWCATLGSLVRWNKLDGTCRQYTAADGYAPWVVTCMRKDDKGILWFGSYLGLIRFDGNMFTSFTAENSGLLSNSVYSVAPAGNGVIWIGTFYGVSRFDGKTWTNYTTANSGIASNAVSSIAVDKKGVVWFAHNFYEQTGKEAQGLSSFDGISWKTYIPMSGTTKYPYVRSIAVDSGNAKWFGTDQKLFRFDGATWTEYPIQFANDMTVDSTGKLWVAAGGDPPYSAVPVLCLSSFDGTSWTQYPLESKLDRLIENYSRVRVDSDGTVWFVAECNSTSLSLHSYKGSTVKTYQVDGPLSHSMFDMSEDKRNIKWFATGYGVSSFDGTAWKNHYFKLTRDDIGPSGDLDNWNLNVNWIRNIAVDHDNTVWAISMGGDVVMSYNSQSWKYYTHYLDDTFTSVVSSNSTLMVDKNNVKWFSGRSVVSYDGNKWTTYKKREINCCSGAVDNDNVKWFGTRNDGVWSFDDSVWEHYDESNSPLSSEYPIMVAAGSINIKWFAETTGMIHHFDGTTWKTYAPEVTGYPANSGVGNLYVDRYNVLWITTGRFLMSFDGTTWKNWNNTKIGDISALMVDANGYLWISTPTGTGESGSLTAMKVYSGPAEVAEASALPKTLAFTGNYPNPFNPSTTLSFVLPKAGTTSLAVYDITGRKVRDLAVGTMTAGAHSAVWDGRDSAGRAVSSGVYFARLSLGGAVTTHRMMLMK